MGLESTRGDPALSRGGSGVLTQLHDADDKVYLGYYFSPSRFGDLALILCGILLFFFPTNITLCAFVAFLHWSRLLGVFRSAEKVALVLIPILGSLFSLLPLLLVTFIVFMGLCQSLDVLKSNFLPDGQFEKNDSLFYALFIFLYLGELDGINPLEERPVVMAFFILSVLVFSIWLLNIFIGVIMDSYQDQKKNATQIFACNRASGILTYLLRASRLPSNLPPVGSLRLTAITAAAAGACVIVQLLPLIGQKWPFRYAILVFTPSLILLQLATFQRDEARGVLREDTDKQPHAHAPWNTLTHSGSSHYMWFVRQMDAPCQKQESEKTTMELLKEIKEKQGGSRDEMTLGELRTIRELLKEIKDDQGGSRRDQGEIKEMLKNMQTNPDSEGVGQLTVDP